MPLLHQKKICLQVQKSANHWSVNNRMIFESHAHYDDESFDGDRDILLTSMPENGIQKIINVCAEVKGWPGTVALMEKYPYVYGAVGVHPDGIDAMTEAKIQEMHELCKLDKMVAVGEIGLDYYVPAYAKENPELDYSAREKEQRQKQIYWFERQMDVAREEKLPFIIHSRDAAKDTLDSMKRMCAGEIGGVVHCFSYGKEMAREYLNMGLYLGVGGVVTFKNARKLKEVVEYVPLTSILLETDSPYLAPVPNRGKRNSSLNLPYVVEMIAQIKGVDTDTVEQITWENAHHLFSKIK